MMMMMMIAIIMTIIIMMMTTTTAMTTTNDADADADGYGDGEGDGGDKDNDDDANTTCLTGVNQVKHESAVNIWVEGIDSSNDLLNSMIQPTKRTRRQLMDRKVIIVCRPC